MYPDGNKTYCSNYFVYHRISVEIEKSSIKPLLLSVVSRMVIMAIGTAIFIQLFSGLVADKTFFIAILLYFMCPPA
ncbi:MAG: hypothetical protein K0R46_1635 [Herbinix sp.]|jgi:hypothetical protein|nr:hypothetical protein [Herbinix sp.]